MPLAAHTRIFLEKPLRLLDGGEQLLGASSRLELDGAWIPDPAAGMPTLTSGLTLGGPGVSPSLLGVDGIEAGWLGS